MPFVVFSCRLYAQKWLKPVTTDWLLSQCFLVLRITLVWIDAICSFSATAVEHIRTRFLENDSPRWVQSLHFLQLLTVTLFSVHSPTTDEIEANQRLGRAWSTMNSLDEGLWRCRYLCKRAKVWVFRSLVLPVSLYSCETWTLTCELRRRLTSLGIMSLRRIRGYRWL